MTGIGFVDVDFGEHGDISYEDFYTATCIDPSPLLFEIPEHCPGKVSEQIEKAFVCVLGDPSAAVNHIRTAVERLLDVQHVAKTRPRKKGGGRERITLHDRIGLMKNVQARGVLTAVKWLGNAGSHAGEMDREHAFDALDLMERALRLLYVDHDRRLDKLVTSINTRKGVPRKRSP